jgi:hypothetical protein
LTVEGSASASSKKRLGEVGKVGAECVAQVVEFGRDRFGLVVERPFVEQAEEGGSLGGVEFDGSGGADGVEHGAEARGVLYVLQPCDERLPRVPGEGDVAAAERDRDAVEAFRHDREATFLSPGALGSDTAEGKWVPRRAAARDEGLSLGA